MKDVLQNGPHPCGDGKKVKPFCIVKQEPRTDPQHEEAAQATRKISRLAWWWKAGDYIVAPWAIAVLIFDPNFLDGFIDFLETGQYLACVNGIFEGKTPYKDFFVLFGPFQIYAISGIMAVFGKTIATFKVFFYLNYIFSFLAVYFLARQILRRRILAYLATLVCLVEVSHPFWATSWDFGRMGLGMIVLLVLLVFARRRDMRLIFVAGILSAVTLFYTLDVGLLVICASLAFFAALLLEDKGAEGTEKGRSFIRLLLWYISGGLVIMGPFFTFMALTGGLGSYVEAAFYVLPRYHMKTWGQAVPSLLEGIKTAQGIWGFARSEVFRVYLPIPIYTLIATYLITALIRRRWNKEVSFVIPLFVYGVLAYRTSFRSILGPQFQVALPPFILLISLFLERWLDSVCARDEHLLPGRQTRGWPALLKTVAIGLSLVLAVTYFLISPKRYYGTLEGWYLYQQFKPGLVVTYSFPVPRDRLNLVRSKVERIGDAMIPSWQEAQVSRVVEYLRKNTKEGEEIFCFPEHGLYHFLAERPGSTRFHIPGMAWTTPAYRAELLQELRSQKPRIIVFSTELSNLAKSIGRTEELLPEVSSYITQRYRIAQQFGSILIYVRIE